MTYSRATYESINRRLNETRISTDANNTIIGRVRFKWYILRTFIKYVVYTWHIIVYLNFRCC